MARELYDTLQKLMRSTGEQIPATHPSPGETLSGSAARNAFHQWAIRVGEELNTSNMVWSLEEAGMLHREGDVAVDRWVYTTCGFCATGCGLFLGVKDGRAVAVKGNPHYPVNRGMVSCLKGLYQWKTLHHPERATTPMVRKHGELVPVTWEEALDTMVSKMQEVMADLGPDGIGIYSSGQLLLEESYALAKLAKGGIGTANLDSNLRLCMASAVQGQIRSFGTDGPPGCYEDFDTSQCLVLFGCNPAEMHPQLWYRIIKNKRQNGAKLVVVDPRQTLPAQLADVHLQLKSGTNVALLNGLMHLLVKNGWIDQPFINRHTVGFADLLAKIKEYPPEVTAEITGVPAERLKEAAQLFGTSPSATTLFVQGVLQSAQATEAACLINTMHLITGKIGKPGSAPFSITGQCASMSHREVGASAHLPGYRNSKNPEHRAEVAWLWGIPPDILPSSTRPIGAMLREVEAGRLAFLWNIATNPAVSLPDQAFTRAMLDKVFLVVQDIFYPMETAAYADVFLPAAQWGEKTGVFTNAERRVNLVQKAVQPPGQAKSDLEIIQQVAALLGVGNLLPWQNSEEVFEEWKGLSRGRPNDMGGITYRRLQAEGGIQWPCPHPDHPGTPRLYTDHRFATRPTEVQVCGQWEDPEGRARLWAVDYKSGHSETSREYPLILNTGRVIEHYHTRVKTKRIPELHRISHYPQVDIHPQDADLFGIITGDQVKIISPRGWAVAEAVVTDRVLPGHLFLPFHFGDLDPGEDAHPQAANHLTGWAQDPFSSQPLLKNAACKLERLPPRQWD